MKFNFNANEVAPNQGLQPIPAGEYEVALISATQRENKESTGSHLACTLEILSGDYKGRKLFHNLNLWNTSQAAVEFAQGTLSAICHATGVMELEDTDQLIGIPVRAEVKLGNGGKYGDTNSVTGYSSMDVEPGAADAASLVS